MNARKHYGMQSACARCDQDIEWHGKEGGWIDRGGNRSCVPYKDKGEIVIPPASAKHAPRAIRKDADDMYRIRP